MPALLTLLFSLASAQVAAKSVAKPELVVQRGHTSDINAAAFSPNGRRIASASADGTLKLWDSETGKELRSLLGHKDSVTAVVFSASGAHLLTGSSDNTVKLWDASTGVVLRTFVSKPSGSFNAVAFSPDETRVLAGCSYGTIKLWTIADGKEQRSFGKHARLVSSVAFAPDGQTFVSGSDDATIKQWDVTSGKELATWRGHEAGVNALAFSTDGNKVISAGGDKTIKIWFVKSGKALATLRGHTEQVLAVAVSKDGRRVVSASKDLSVRLWDLPNAKLMRTFTGHTASVFSVRLSPDEGQLLSGGEDRTMRLWDLESGRLLRVFRGYVDNVLALAATADGQGFVSGHENGTMKLWSVTHGVGLRSLAPSARGARNWVTGVAFSADGKQLASSSGGAASEDYSVRIWDAASGQVLRTLSGHQDWVNAVAVAPTGQLVASGSGSVIKEADYTVKLWNSGTGAIMHTLKGHEASVNAVAFSPDGRTLVSTSDDRTARLWDVTSGAALRTLSGHEGIVYAAAFSPNGRQLITGGTDRTVHLWDVASGAELRRFSGHSDAVRSLAWVADGNCFASGSTDTTIRLWDRETGDTVATFSGHTGDVTALAFAGARFFSGSTDGTVRLWSITGGPEVATFLAIGESDFMVTTPDNYYWSTKGGLRGVAFRVGAEVYPFEQFDLRLNRPDIVLERLGGAAPELLASYKKAHERRLAKMHLSEDTLGEDLHLPTLALASTVPVTSKQKKLTLKLRADDSTYRLSRVNVFINDVPVHGSAGIAWRGGLEQSVTLDLLNGENKIQVSVLNARGAESLRKTVYVNYTGPETKPDRYVVTIGVSAYVDAQYNLTYAAKDARDMAAFFKGGSAKRFGRVKTLTILDKDATREKIRAAKQFLAQSKVDDQVIVFVAGHGVLDASRDYFFGTTDIDFDKPVSRGLPYGELEQLVDGIPALDKLILIDTCHSGEVDHDAEAVSAPEGKVTGRVVGARGMQKKGTLRLTDSFELLRTLFADLQRASGAVVIASAGGAEYALEAPEWNNGVFTYAVLDGLKSGGADADKNGVTTVTELRDYVVDKVRRLTGGQQTPTARKESLEFDFAL